ncbi:MAG: TRAP transporter large permease subunit [Candidatus Eisenbacteria bacterium]
MGGIYSGMLTVLEAASVTALYALVSQVWIYRDVPMRRIPAIAAESMTLVGGILIILSRPQSHELPHRRAGAAAPCWSGQGG